MDFLNPWMLAGLASLAIPVLIHLLSRRKIDVLDWGAMQFLEPSPRQRRSLWIENFWLMLLRMAVLTALVLALTRPWFQSAWLARLTTVRPQDVALIVDGSYSLDRMNQQQLEVDAAHRMVRQVFDQLDLSDLVQVYDAREQTRPRLPSYTRDLTAAREAVLDLPAPSGSSDLVSALTVAARDLLQTGNLDREIVIVTDGQRFPWRLHDPAAWKSFDTLHKQARVPPRVWIVKTTAPDQPPARNLSIGPIELSRELAMPGSRIRARAPVRSTGFDGPMTCDVELLIDGIRSPSHTTSLRVPAQGTASVEFDVTLERAGGHALRIQLSVEDDLAADNQAVAAVEIGGGWPVLLVDGTLPANEPAAAETFFMEAALDGGEDGWIRPTVVSQDAWAEISLQDYAAIILANVRPLSDDQVKELSEFTEGGGGVLVTLGDQTLAIPDDAEPGELTPWQRWLRVQPREIAGHPEDDSAATTILAESLQLPWQERFRRQRGSGFSAVRYQQWWRTVVPEAVGEPEDVVSNDVRIVARFATGDPALAWERRGEGAVAIWTSSLDADWNALASKPDYVAWWHEVLFALLEPTNRRNVAVGEPLIARSPAGGETVSGVFLGPNKLHDSGEAWSLGSQKGRRLPSARWPGIYAFLSGKAVQGDLSQVLVDGGSQIFAATADAGESDLTLLTEADEMAITKGRDIHFISSPAELESAWLGETGRTELAMPLLYLLMGFLVLEVWLTRRLVKRGAALESGE